MMRCLLLFILCSGCVTSDIAVDYAKRAHPECSQHQALSHRLGGHSLTEVQMRCGELSRSITVKCVFGYGIFADTTCHENN